jgi:hypothetical protein
MRYSVGSSLPEYRVKAFIDTSNPINRIQDDAFAIRYGFKAGLVPGCSVAAFMTRPLIETAGRDWLARGSAEVRLIRPVYEGEEIHISGSIASIAQDEAFSLEYQAENTQGATCALGIAHLPPATPATEPSRDDYAAGKHKLNRPVLLQTLKKGEALTPIISDFNWNIHWQYCRKSIRDYHPIYEKTMHPGWLLSQASQILAANYEIQAWIDAACQVQHFHLLEEECAIETRGRVQDKFELNGDHFIVLDLAVFTPTCCLATVCYTAIFRIAPNAA